MDDFPRELNTLKTIRQSSSPKASDAEKSKHDNKTKSPKNEDKSKDEDKPHTKSKDADKKHTKSKSHPKPTDILTTTHTPSKPSSTKSIASSSSSTAFSYPTPSSVPSASGKIMGLSLAVAFLMIFIIFGVTAWCCVRRRSRRKAEKMHTVESPVISAPVQVKSSKRERTWYGRKVPSGWI